MSLITVDLRSRTPIFEQIIESVKALVLRGLLPPDEHMPSVRQLASELAINPNTIQKAYAELERQGVIYSLAGRGSFVSSDTKTLTDAHRTELIGALENSAQDALEYGIAESQIKSAVDGVCANFKGGRRA